MRPHLQNIDNVPLLVPLFTDCTPESECCGWVLSQLALEHCQPLAPRRLQRGVGFPRREQRKLGWGEPGVSRGQEPSVTHSRDSEVTAFVQCL